MADTQIHAPVAHHPGIFKRIISRVRQNDVHIHHHSSNQHGGGAGHYHLEEDFERSGRRTPSFKAGLRGGATNSPARTASTSSRHRRKASSGLPLRAGASTSYPSPNPRVHPEAPTSRELWEEAYDSLRLDPNTANLVVTYESIVTKELPEELRAAAHSALTPSDGDKDRRMELANAIVSAKMNKRRGSKASQTSEMPRVVLEHSQKTIEAMWDEFPSTALAWAGLCTLTPLLIDPILRQEEFYKGMVHIIGRIPWYMHLAHLLRCPLWHDADDFERRQEEFRTRRDRCRTAVLTLYRRVLEFEMNCVCATASAWNSVARHTVRWNGLAELNEQIREADRVVRQLVAENVVESTKQAQMLYLDVDLDVEALEKEKEREASLEMNEEDRQRQRQQA